MEHNNTGLQEEHQSFLETSSLNVPPLLNNYRRKGLAPPAYHHTPNHKTRLQYSPQEVNPIQYEKVPANYPYYQERGGSMQSQWPQAGVPQETVPFNTDIYQGNQDSNNQRLLPSILGNIAEVGQELYDTYNEDNEEPLGSQSAADRDRDERESLQETNDKVLYQNKNMGKIKNNPQSTPQNIIKRNVNGLNKKLSLPRVTAAASLASSTGFDGSIDLVFATHWVPASEREMVLLTNADLKCIKTRLEQAEREKFHDEKLHASSTRECLSDRGVTLNNDDGKNMLRIDKGQLTVYRIQLNCNCTQLNPETEICSKPLNFNRQSWLNWGGNSYYKKRLQPL